MADGTEATVEGILTTNLGALESARGGFVQDTTGGIAIYVDAAFGDPIPAGMRVRLAGTLDSRFEQRTLRVDREDVIVVGTDQLPAAFAASTGEASEPLEGARLELTGTVTETPGQLSDGLGITIDDGSGPVRVVAGSAALGGAAPAKGSIVVARGPLGQRETEKANEESGAEEGVDGAQSQALPLDEHQPFQAAIDATRMNAQLFDQGFQLDG